MAGGLTQAQRMAYRERGYISPLPALAPDEAARYRAALERSCGSDARPGHTRQPPTRVKPYLLFPWAAELVRHPRVLDAVAAVIGPDILVFHTTVWLKEPQSEAFVPWHQDATYFGLSPHEHVTAWVALTDSTPEMGCVQVVPGSHAAGQRAHQDRPSADTMLSRGQTLTEAPADAVVDLALRAGEMSLHHTHLLHRSGPNRSAGRRIGVGISYIPAHVRHVGPTRLSATLVRGCDAHGHFDPEPRPAGEADAAARAAHADALGRFWKASEAIPEMALAH